MDIMRNAECRIRNGKRVASAVAALLPILRLSLVSSFVAAGMGFGALEADDKTGDDREESKIQKRARGMAQTVTLSTVVDGKRRELEMLDQPVLRYGDIPRANDLGSVWIWQLDGRPQAVMELYRGTNGRAWAHVVHSLAAGGIIGDFGGGAPKWTPSEPGIKWNNIGNEPVPAERPAVRVRQIKELAQRFTAHEFWDPNNSRFELRLLVQPVHKYSNAASGLLDGAVFLLCHETNPEVVLLIEAVQGTDAAAAFRYALARLGHAELHVEFDGKEVWKQRRIDNPRSSDAYFLIMK